MFKKIALLLVIILMFSVAVVGCNGQEQGDDTQDTSLIDIKEKGSFTLGLDATFAPMGYTDTNGEIVGFDIDLAKEVAHKMGVELNIQPIDWDSKIMELNNGNIDVIWNGLTITEDRQKEMGFSKPYLNNKQIIVVNADSDIDTKTDLADKIVGVQLDSSGQDALEADTEVLETLKNVQKYGTFNEALMDLSTGRIDAVVVDEILGRYVIGKKPGEYKVASEDFGEEQYGIGFRKGDQEFINKVNKVLDELIEDGTTAKISEKWFGENIVLK